MVQTGKHRKAQETKARGEIEEVDDPKWEMVRCTVPGHEPRVGSQRP